MKNPLRILLVVSLFAAATGIMAQAADIPKATVVFYRPAKMSGAIIPFNVGSSLPDTVFKPVGNGAWWEVELKDLREWNFIGGLYKNTASLKLKLEPGKKFYVRCRVKESIPTVVGAFELVDEETALKEISKLKKQP